MIISPSLRKTCGRVDPRPVAVLTLCGGFWRIPLPPSLLRSVSVFISKHLEMVKVKNRAYHYNVYLYSSDSSVRRRGGNELNSHLYVVERGLGGPPPPRRFPTGLFPPGVFPPPGQVPTRSFPTRAIIFSRPFAVFLIRLRSGGGGKRRVGNGTGGK